MTRALQELLSANDQHVERYRSRFEDLQDSQAPEVVTVCCSDSRVLQDHMWTNEDPGHVFTVSNIGNRVVQRTADGTVVSGDVLYPIEHTGTDTAVVVGHSGCGAVTAAYDSLTDGLTEPPGIEHCLSVLEPRLEPALDLLPEDVSRENAIERLVEYNVDRQVDALLDSEDVPETVTVAGVVYDFRDSYDGQRGAVHLVNVDGVRSVDELRTRHSDLDSRIQRLFEY